MTHRDCTGQQVMHGILQTPRLAPAHVPAEPRTPSYKKGVLSTADTCLLSHLVSIFVGPGPSSRKQTAGCSFSRGSLARSSPLGLELTASLGGFLNHPWTFGPRRSGVGPVVVTVQAAL